jgi:dihydrofolate reductase
MKPFSLIAAVDRNYGIGKDNHLPWPRLHGDLSYFAQVTTGVGDNAVIMGRKTWESFPETVRPLQKRLNIVLTKDLTVALPAGVLRASTLDEALEKAKKYEEIFVIGGGTVYAEAIRHPSCNTIYITEIEGSFSCDTFFPHFDKKKFLEVSKSAVQEESGLEYYFVVYKSTIAGLESSSSLPQQNRLHPDLL